MSHQSIGVALPWSLSHYISLNGFHPLYHALIDHAPQEIQLHAWDNIKLYNCFQKNIVVRTSVLEAAVDTNRKLQKYSSESIERGYGDYFWPPNQILSNQLPGDIEFHHTAPFPSLRRPFVFHCESFSPIFTPFVAQGGGGFQNHGKLCEYYRAIFANPLCLGIFSHIPNTLESLSRFFADADIDKKLFSSRIGMSSKAIRGIEIPKEKELSPTRFMFLNSAHQNPKNFFNRGGHIVLRFWKEFKARGRDGQLIMRCTKPSRSDLHEYGVDTSFLDAEAGQSILWAEDYLSSDELNALMAKSHFFLLPSSSLHSAAIMETMGFGMVPVLTDTVGTSEYLTDEKHGIVLKGVRKALWSKDPNTGILVDHYCRRPYLDDSLVFQMTNRIFKILDEPEAYAKMRNRILARAKQFSGQAFSDSFWASVIDLYQNSKHRFSHDRYLPGQIFKSLQGCILDKRGWPRVLKSVPQPMQRINTGQNFVWELGGAFLHVTANKEIKTNDWSVFAQYFSSDAPVISFAENMEGLGGKFLVYNRELGHRSFYGLIPFISRILKPFPRVHGFAKKLCHKLFKYKNYLRRYSLFLRFSFSGSCIEPDIELVVHRVHGYNIIRFFHKYIAIPQNEGEFIPVKLRSRGYSSSFSGRSIDGVLGKIFKTNSKNMQITEDSIADSDLPILVEELKDYNIILMDEKYFAILKSEGEFIYERVLAGLYTNLFSGDSKEAVNALILSNTGSNNNQSKGV